MPAVFEGLSRALKNKRPERCTAGRCDFNTVNRKPFGEKNETSQPGAKKSKRNR